MGSMVLSAFFFALMAGAAKLAHRWLPMQEIVFFRSAIALAITIAQLRRAGLPIFAGRPSLGLTRGVLGFLALSGYFISIANLPLAEAVLIQQTHPLWTMILAALFLRESIGWRVVPSFILTMAGVVLVTGWRSDQWHGGWAVWVGLGAALCSGGAYVVVRALSRTEHPLSIIFWFPFIATPASVPGMLASGWVTPHLPAAAWLLAAGVAAQLGQIFLTKGLASTAASRAVLANTSSVAWGALLGWMVFTEPLTGTHLAGMVLLALGLWVAARAHTGVRRAEA